MAWSNRNLLLFFYDPHGSGRACQVVLEVKSPPANAQDIRGVGLIPGSGRSPGGVHGNPLQYFCLENPMDRGAWWTVVHRVAKSWTWLKWQLARTVQEARSSKSRRLLSPASSEAYGDDSLLLLPASECSRHFLTWDGITPNSASVFTCLPSVSVSKFPSS